MKNKRFLIPIIMATLLVGYFTFNMIDWSGLSEKFRKGSSITFAASKPFADAFKSGTRYTSQLYPSHKSPVFFEKTVLNKKLVKIPLGKYNTNTIGKVAKGLKVVGRVSGAIGIVTGGVSIYNDGLNWSNGLDTAMSALALTPTGWGQAIAGIYFGANFVTQLITDKDIGQHIESAINGE